jgi:hypothetical protein
MHLMGKICEILGRDVPMVTPQEIAAAVNICGRECLDDFLEEHATSYNLQAVVEGRETICGLPFVLWDRSPNGESSSLTLFTPRPGHEWAFLGEHAHATGS